MHATEQDVSISKAEQKEAVTQAPAEAPKTVVKKKPGRAFRHKLLGKFLAESGEFIFCTLRL